MDVLGTILAFIGVLVVLVLVHELGHFIVAKRAGITVQEFGVGFPPRIGSVVWHGTRYSLNWIPLGGFVKMLGEDGEAEADKMRRARPLGGRGRQGHGGRLQSQADLGADRRPGGGRRHELPACSGPLRGRASACRAAKGRGPLTVTEIQAGSPAVAAGLEVGDVIVAADGRTLPCLAGPDRLRSLAGGTPCRAHRPP